MKLKRFIGNRGVEVDDHRPKMWQLGYIYF